MKIVQGDIIQLALNGDFDVIIHGCNCFCTMGAGIAKTIKQLFPAAYEADLKTTKGDKDKLGYYTFCRVTTENADFIITNAYTQYQWRGRNNADYDAIRNIFRRVATDFSGKRIGYPAIGAGLAGGDWDIISQIINEELKGEEHTFVQYVPPT